MIWETLKGRTLNKNSGNEKGCEAFALGEIKKDGCLSVPSPLLGGRLTDYRLKKLSGKYFSSIALSGPSCCEKTESLSALSGV